MSQREAQFKAESATVSCSVEGCLRGVRAKGMCGKHYQRFRTHGAIDNPPKALPPWRVCSIKSCDQPSRTRNGGTCEKHYARYRRTGKYDAPVFGAWAETQHGYVARLDRDHPAAAPSGYVYQHRAVLFDAIGAGSHKCHWCGREVAWRAEGSRKLVVDHLDGDKKRNEPGNLVPSCHRCNSTRGLFQRWVTEHRDDPFLWALYEASRPA